jgi:hypothetical protein
MTEIDVPRGFLKVNRAPSLRAGKAKRAKLAQLRTSNGCYAHFRNWAQRIHHPLDPPDGPFPRIRSANRLHGIIGLIKSKTRIHSTSTRRQLFTSLWLIIASFDGLVIRQGQRVFGGGELNAFRYRSFFGGRIIVGWYTWRAVIHGRRCDLDGCVECDWLCRPRSFRNVVLEDTRDICTRDVRLIERNGILKKTNHFERPGVSASRESL